VDFEYEIAWDFLRRRPAWTAATRPNPAAQGKAVGIGCRKIGAGPNGPSLVLDGAFIQFDSVPFQQQLGMSLIGVKRVTARRTLLLVAFCLVPRASPWAFGSNPFGASRQKKTWMKPLACQPQVFSSSRQAQEFARLAQRGDVEIVIAIVPPDDPAALPAVDIREYVDTPKYTGPMKKGVRVSCDRLPEVVGLLESQARELDQTASPQKLLFPETKKPSAASFQRVSTSDESDAILAELAPDGIKDFPDAFLDDRAAAGEVFPATERIAIHQESLGVREDRPK